MWQAKRLCNAHLKGLREAEKEKSEMSEDFLLCSKIFVAILFAFVRRKKKRANKQNKRKKQEFKMVQGCI